MLFLDFKMKKCIRCNTLKSLESFHKHKKMKDGYLNKCSKCVVLDVAEWRKNNPDARKKERIKHREKRGQMTREQYLNKRKEHKAGRNITALKYAYKRRRLQEKMFSTELDLFVFEEAVRLCKMREKITGFKWHVDHIVPLMHKQACGLNSAFNLQVVPASWNVKKGNRNMDTYFPISGY